MGGQVGHNITNVGPQLGSIPPPIRKEIMEHLRKYDAAPVTITSVMGEGEAARLADQIKVMLEDEDWEIKARSRAVIPPTPQGIRIEMPDELEEAVALGELFLQAGLKTVGALDEDIGYIRVVVGANI